MLMPVDDAPAEVICLAQTRDKARRKLIQQLRQRYLDGTLDEVLLPKETEIPDSLLRALFPQVFGSPRVEA